MKKVIATAVVAAFAVAMLSGCSSMAKSGNAAGTTHQAVTTAENTTQAAPATTADNTTQAAPATPNYTVAQQNAIQSAQSYLDMGSGFSRAGLIQQLSSTAGEGFHMADAVFAVGHIQVNWNAQAVMSAKSYMKMSSFSRASLIDQLSSAAGEQYTRAQATYAADQVGLN